MGECPVCGELTSNTSTRLIKDSCGHTKCRLCLLKEENGCTICNGESARVVEQKIDCIGNFDFPLHLDKPSNYENTNFVSQEILVDKSYNYHIGSSVNLVINEEIPKGNKHFYEREDTMEEVNVINETHELDHEAFELTLQESNVNDGIGNIIGKIGENVLEFIEKEAFNTGPREVIAIQEQGKIVGNTIQNDASEKCVSLHLSAERSNLNYQSEDATNKISNISPNSDCRLPKKRFVAEQTQNLIQKLEESQSEDYDQLIAPAIIVNRSPNKSPNANWLSVEGSPRIEVSEVIGNRTPNLDLFNKTPNHHVNSKSPDFRFQDFLIFRRPGDVIDSKIFDSPVSFEDLKNPDLESKVSEFTFCNNKTLDENKHEAKFLLLELVSNNLKKPAHLVNTVHDNINVINPIILEGDNIPIECVKNYSNNLGDLMSKLEGKTDTNESTVNESLNHKAQCDNVSINLNNFVEKGERNVQEEENEDENKENKEYIKLENHIENKIDDQINKCSDNIDNYQYQKNQDVETKMDKPRIENHEKKNKSSKMQKKNIKVQYEDQENDKIKKKKLAYQRREPNRDWSHILILPTNPPTYKCSICKKVFKSLKGRGYHVSCLRGDVPFQCKICDRVFAKRSHFEYHERVHQDYKPFVCRICGKKFVQKNKLNRHVQIHNQSCEYECADCGNKYMTKEYLKNHIMVHMKLSFPCTICTKSFSYDTNRRRHERTHTTARPYECEICNKRFKSKFLKTRHRKSHENISRTFQCDQCKRFFMYKFEVQRHMHVHSSKTPFKCNLCKLRFRRRDNLLRHVRNHHPDEQEIAFRDETKALHEIKSAENLNKEKTFFQFKNDEKSNKKVHKLEKSTKKLLEKGQIESLKKLEKKEERLRLNRISRTNSTSSAASLKLSKRFIPNSLHSAAVLPDSDVPISSPINIQRLDDSEEVNRSLIDPIPLEKALDLNKQIEEKIYKQSSFFCDFPGLSRNITSNVGRKDSGGSNSNSNDGFNQERSKNGQSSIEKYTDCSEIVRKDLHIHWRRRTAESLRSKMNKNKQT